jgi:hypothetical protein
VVLSRESLKRGNRGAIRLNVATEARRPADDPNVGAELAGLVRIGDEFLPPISELFIVNEGLESLENEVVGHVEWSLRRSAGRGSHVRPSRNSGRALVLSGQRGKRVVCAGDF